MSPIYCKLTQEYLMLVTWRNLIGNSAVLSAILLLMKKSVTLRYHVWVLSGNVEVHIQMLLVGLCLLQLAFHSILRYDLVSWIVEVVLILELLCSRCNQSHLIITNMQGIKSDVILYLRFLYCRFFSLCLCSLPRTNLVQMVLSEIKRFLQGRGLF